MSICDGSKDELRRSNDSFCAQNNLFLKTKTKVENIKVIIVPSASVLQPFQDSLVCHALNMPTI